MAPRPKRRRMLEEPPINSGFVPNNGEYDAKEHIVLLYEEYEALKLSDYEGLTQEESAKKMNISRPTFTRIYKATREKIAKAFVENKQILIEGGDVGFKDSWFRCHNCGSVFKEKIAEKEEYKNKCRVCGSNDILPVQETEGEETCHEKGAGHGHGRKGQQGFCICPKCDFRIPHQPGIPCNSQLCPRCEIRMVREGSPHHKLILEKRKTKTNG